jgi:hypothetical protein
MASRSLLLVALLGLLASSCVSMQVPERFLVTTRSDDELKAITPEETKLWVREFDDPDKGDLAFWSDALKRHLVENRGYTLLSEAKVEDGRSVEGVEYLLEATIQGRTMRELLVLFVHEGTLSNTIRVVELVGEKAAFDAAVDEVRASLTTLR